MTLTLMIGDDDGDDDVRSPARPWFGGGDVMPVLLHTVLYPQYSTVQYVALHTRIHELHYFPFLAKPHSQF